MFGKILLSPYKSDIRCTDITKVERYKEALSSKERYVLHHKLETETSDGYPREVPITCKELKALGCYYNRPPEEFIFLTCKEHSIVHNKTCKPPVMYGNRNNKGRKWYTNGFKDIMSYSCPEGFYPGRSKRWVKRG